MPGQHKERGFTMLSKLRIPDIILAGEWRIEFPVRGERTIHSDPVPRFIIRKPDTMSDNDLQNEIDGMMARLVHLGDSL